MARVHGRLVREARALRLAGRAGRVGEMRDGAFVGRIGRRRQVCRQELGQTLRAALRPVHADEVLDARHARGCSAHRATHIVRVYDDGRRVIGKIIIKLVDKAHIDEGRDRADPPAGKQSERIVHTVVGEDGHAIAFVDAELVQCAGVALHRSNSAGETERDIAIDPAQRDFIGSAGGTITQRLMHQHAYRSLFEIIQENPASRPPAKARNSRA